MSDLFTKFRKHRIVLGNFESKVKTQMTIFLGFYNGEKYVDQIFSQLVNQTDQNFFLIVVDNDSRDLTWEKMQVFLNFFPERAKIVKNPFNITGAGSLAVNYDLIETDWWCSFHQDDIYKPDYVAEFNEGIPFLPQEALSLSAEMGSVSEKGLLNAIPPRASWILRGSSPVDLFIANLRTQVIPFPSTAFKTNVFRSMINSWHTTFADSELTLQICGKGTFHFLDKSTMNYRENPMSESHSIPSNEAIFGIGVSLARIFSSSEFKKIASIVEKKDRNLFLKAINNSTSLRLGNTEYCKFIQFLAAENCMIAWNYSDNNSIEQVADYFSNMKAEFSPELLGRILEFLETTNDSVPQVNNPNTSLFLNNFLGFNEIDIQNTSNKKSLARVIYNRFMTKMPFSFQKYVGKFLLQAKVKFSKNHPWDFEWR